MKVRRALGDPFEECREAWMRAKSFWCVVGAGEVGFGQGGVYFVVTDLMKQDSWAAFATAQFGDKMVQALRNMWRNGSVAERAYGVVFHG